MTADLLEETIRITRQTLDEAEQRFPGIREQISELLLVGGSSRMPAVAERLRKEFRWEPRLTDPDLAVAKGAALYAAGQTVRFIEPDARPTASGGRNGTQRRGTLRLPGPVTDEAVQQVADQTGIDAEKVRAIAGRTVVNVLPKAVGVKLLDTSKPGWEDDPRRRRPTSSTSSTRRPSCRSTAATLEASTVVANQPGIEIEIWEQAGASPSQRAGSQPPGRRRGPDRGARALPAARRLAGQHRDRRRRRGHRQAARHRAHQRQGAGDERADQRALRRAGGRGEGNPPRPDHRHVAPSGHARSTKAHTRGVPQEAPGRAGRPR